MGSALSTIVIDAHDVDRLVSFWCAVLGWSRSEAVEPDGAVEIADPQAPGSVTILVQPVPEAKTTKNRLHLDIRPRDRDQTAELERLLDLGATRVDIGQGEQTWVVLADPEGNEFCLLRARVDS
ncbi:VOC family protein [Euzebya tangerina]|uniref:VOC family protein n=1 Tax=Euzebya tangerina TaxID=591198 RepID=UPI000E320587|nr:VOC family protein [Euzebya tangerina]